MTDPLPVGMTFGEWVDQGSALLPPPPDNTVMWGPWDIPAYTEYAVRFTVNVTESISFVRRPVTNSATYTSINADFGSDDVVIIPSGQRPQFTSTPVTDATEDVVYTYEITGTDADLGDPLTFTLLTPAVPTWLFVTDHGDRTATLSGLPTNDEVGDHAVELQVEDSLGLRNFQIFTITVINVNDVPWFSSIPVEEATEDSVYTYDVVATDVDVGDMLAIMAPILPGWLSLVDGGDGTATLSGTPTNSDVGENAVMLHRHPAFHHHGRQHQ